MKGCADSKKKRFPEANRVFHDRINSFRKIPGRHRECEPVITQLDGANTSWSCRDDCCYHLLVIMAMVGHTLTEKRQTEGKRKSFNCLVRQYKFVFNLKTF